MVDRSEVSRLLEEFRSGDREAFARLIPIVYAELHSIASRHLARERPGHTLQPTALLHEAYLRLAGTAAASIQDRPHFFAVAGQVMRNVLVDHARARKTAKRGNLPQRVELDGLQAGAELELDRVLAVDAALTRLAAYDARQARIVELRYFGGLDVEEIAVALGVSSRTVKREWSMAKAWLYTDMGL